MLNLVIILISKIEFNLNLSDRFLIIYFNDDDDNDSRMENDIYLGNI